MSYQALYRAWRPKKFSEICGQDAIVRTLKRQIQTNAIAHAYLFCGSRGTGKTTAAKIFARAINCKNLKDGEPCGECEACRHLQDENNMDVLEIDAASNNGVDDVREILKSFNLQPVVARYRVVIFDEVHMFSKSSFNAFLKTLEEPPQSTVFILATTEPHKLPATILSRCQRFDFRRITVNVIISRLKEVLLGIGREAEDAALHEIARSAEGALRDALSLLDVCLSFTDAVLTAELVRSVLGTAGRDAMFEFTSALLDWDGEAALMKLDELIKLGSDPRVFAQDVTAHLRCILLTSVVKERIEQLADITGEDAQRFMEQAEHSSQAQLTRMIALFMDVESTIKYASMPRTIVELATVRCCRPDQEDDSALSERMDRIEALIKNGIAQAPVRQRSAQPPKERGKESESAPQAAGQAELQAPTAEPPQEYLDAMEQLNVEMSPVRTMLEKLHFGGVMGDVITFKYDTSADTVRKLLERRLAAIEKVFSDHFSRPMHVRFETRNAASPPVTNLARNSMEQAMQIAPRNKIMYTD